MIASTIFVMITCTSVVKLPISFGLLSVQPSTVCKGESLVLLFQKNCYVSLFMWSGNVYPLATSDIP